MSDFYDTHAHLDHPNFASDLPQVLERARTAGIVRIVAVGTDLTSSTRVIQLSEQFAGVFAAAGWHPSEAEKAPEDIRPALRQLALHSKVVALGETGLDFHHLPTEKPGFTPADDERYKRRQRLLFQQHLEVAAELGLNCIIHQRDALDEVLQEMEPFINRVRGVFHCFVNDIAAMQRVISLGSLVSFTGIVTFKNAPKVRETLAATPLDQFLLETDCPFLAPMPYRGKRCEPAHINEIAQTIAQVKGCSLEELGAVTGATARKFFAKLSASQNS